jgi:hypothetical protein
LSMSGAPPVCSLLFFLSSLVIFIFIRFGSTNKKLYVILRVRMQNQSE